MEYYIIKIIITIFIIAVIIVWRQADKQVNVFDDYFAQRNKQLEIFKPSRTIQIYNSLSKKPAEFLVNEENKKFAVLTIDTVEEKKDKLMNEKFNSNIYSQEDLEKEFINIEKEGNTIRLIEYNFSDLIAFELLESSESKLQGRGLITAGGALLFGNVGALVAMNAGDRQIMKDKSFILVNLHVNDLNTPLISISYFDKNDNPEEYYNEGLKNAKEFIAVLDFIKANSTNHNVLTSDNGNDIFSKIEKLAELRDKNLITEEEYIESKSSLLKKLSN